MGLEPAPPFCVSLIGSAELTLLLRESNEPAFLEKSAAKVWGAETVKFVSGA
jgi:hypothetical protein